MSGGTTINQSTNGGINRATSMNEAAGSGMISHSRCVLWVHPQDSVPQPLIKSLSRRIEKTVYSTDGYQALGEVLALKQEGDSAGKPHPIVLLLIKPARLEEADLVLHYLDMYAPKTRRWRFDPSATPVFAPMNEADVAKLARPAVRMGSSGDTAFGMPSPVVSSSSSQSRDGQATASSSARRSVSAPSPAGTPIFPSLRGPGSGVGSSAGGRSGRPTPQPRLRLVEPDPSAETITGAQSLGATNFAQLTPEELQMLLADPPAGNGSRSDERGGQTP